MEMQRYQHGAVTVLKPVGPLSGDDAEAALALMRTVSAQTMGRFAVDLSAVPFVDSRGLEVLAEVSDEMGGSGQALRLCNVPEAVREVFGLTGLARRFEHFDDAAGAARSLL